MAMVAAATPSLRQPSSPTGRAGRGTSDIMSDFDLSLMPRDKIVRRTLTSWSVHNSNTTNKWIATIARSDLQQQRPGRSSRHIQFQFPSERDARKFCKAYAPPKLSTGSSCQLCNHAPTNRHCRNCGVCVCDNCSTKWGVRMVPKTYTNSGAMFQRVCRSCDWLSNAFCLALLKGRYTDVITLYETGNLNLRTSFADIRQEAMFPVHCAVMGGSVELLKWLVDVHGCPVSVKADPKTGQPRSVQTSAGRTLLDVAMSGIRPRVETLVYLIRKGLSISDVKDPTLVPKTLEAILKAGYPLETALPTTLAVADSPATESFDENSTCIEDACFLCCEKQMDCVLTPCGHQMCCADCGSQLRVCPICKNPCSVLKVFRQ